MKITWRNNLKTVLHSSVPCLAVIALCIGCGAGGSADKDFPNVVVFLADDQGWGDLSLHGNTNLSTPHIDSLAHDGAMFEHFYVCSVCAPTRAEFLTGRYYARGGVRGVSTGLERLNADEHTIAQTFRRAGYQTGAFGKWHNGTQHPYHPSARGFGEFYGITEGHWGHYFNYELDHNGTLVQGEGYVTDDFTSHAIDFMEQHREEPFFVYLPYNTPHSPMQVPDEYWDRFKSRELAMLNRDPPNEDIPKTRAALAMVENIDWNVGRVLQKLDELDLSKETIVVYFSDNGPNSWRWNGGMKGRKGSIDEGGLRSPLLVRWPGNIPAGLKVTKIAGAIDLLPTLSDLAGIEMTGEKPLDGKSLKPLLTDEQSEWPDRVLFSLRQARGQTMLSARDQRFRLDYEGRLFDIEQDPGQYVDISQSMPEDAARLQAAAEAIWKEVESNVGPDDRPFSVGHSDMTLLPARDGRPHGEVKRSGNAPNCSFFTNWTNPSDKITWDIEVAEAGEYEISVYYTVPEADVGSKIKVTFGDASLEATFNEAHDPPLYGDKEDRVWRGLGESLVKDFKPYVLGNINLSKSRAMLTFQALEVPGKQVADIRYAVLTKVP